MNSGMMNTDDSNTIIETTLTVNNDALNLVGTVNELYLDIVKLGDILSLKINADNNLDLSDLRNMELDLLYKDFYHQSSLDLIKVKELQKLIYINLEEKRNELELKKDLVDRMQLNYENLLYKQAYLQREIKSCITNTPHLNEIKKEFHEDLGTTCYSSNLSIIHENTIQKLLEEQQSRIHTRNQVDLLQEEKLLLLQKLDKKRKLVDELPAKIESIQIIAKNIITQFDNINEE